jgi:hypothetical protein
MEENNKQNIKLATMQKDIEYIKKSIDSLTDSVNVHIIQCEKKYANKWVEGAIVFVIIGVFGGLITYMMTNILK